MGAGYGAAVGGRGAAAPGGGGPPGNHARKNPGRIDPSGSASGGSPPGAPTRPQGNPYDDRCAQQRDGAPGMESKRCGQGPRDHPKVRVGMVRTRPCASSPMEGAASGPEQAISVTGLTNVHPFHHGSGWLVAAPISLFSSFKSIAPLISHGQGGALTVGSLRRFVTSSTEYWAAKKNQHQYRISTPSPTRNINGNEHPSSLPALRWRPLRERGIPIFREIRACAWEMPKALRQEKESPGMPEFLRLTLPPRLDGYRLGAFHIRFEILQRGDPSSSESHARWRCPTRLRSGRKPQR